MNNRYYDSDWHSNPWRGHTFSTHQYPQTWVFFLALQFYCDTFPLWFHYFLSYMKRKDKKKSCMSCSSALGLSLERWPKFEMASAGVIAHSPARQMSSVTFISEVFGGWLSRWVSVSWPGAEMLLRCNRKLLQCNLHLTRGCSLCFLSSRFISFIN